VPRIFGACEQALEFLDAQHLWELRPSRPWGEVEVEDIPIAYLPGNSLRTRVRVIGDIAGGGIA